MSERAMRQAVVRALRPLHAVSVECPTRPGFPDVSYADGLLELKWVRRWPSRSGTPLEVDHYTPQQRLFHVKREKVGGRMFVVLQVNQEWMVFRGADAARRLGYADIRELLQLAIFRFASPGELLPWLKQQQR